MRSGHDARFPSGGALAAAFAAVVGGLKLGQHFSLQTQAYDLGLFANVLWNTLHGRFLFNSLTGASYGGDHFSPLLPVLSPLFLLWKNAAVLLLVQTGALAAAIPAVHRLAERFLGRAGAAAFAVLFAVFPYVHHVSRFDFHDAAFAIPLYLWALVFWDEGRTRAFWGTLVPATLLREDMALVTAGLGIYIAFLSERRNDPAWRRAGLGIAAGAAILFVLEMTVILPAFGSWRSAAFSYANLGGDLPSILKSLLNPVILWQNSLGDPARLKGLAVLAAWTGGLAFLAPRALFLVAVPVALNLLAGRSAQNTFQLHYAATVIPFLFYAMVRGAAVLARWRPGLPSWILPSALSVAALMAFPPVFIRVGPEKRAAARELLARIPLEDSVQLSHNLFPHAALRERVGLFPMDHPTRWVLLDRKMTGFHPPADYLADVDAFARVHAGRRVADVNGFQLYRFPEAP